MNEAVENIVIDDLKGEQREMAELIGIDAYKKMIVYYAGTNIYIPKLSEIERKKRNEKIRAEYEKDGNITSLAIKYDLTEAQIRNIIADIFQNKRNAPVKGQLTIYDI